MTHLLDLCGADIVKLSDSEVRELVARLCEEQLRKGSLPTTAVTWGGDQNAPDGGVDVRVSLPGDAAILGFVPRSSTGIQVRHSNMRPAAITKEMRPDGVLRPVISELATRHGAYIIASAQASTTDSELRRRVAAMRAAVSDDPNASRLHLDFYDQGRIATALREYGSLVTWVREKIGRPLSGWYGYGSWPVAASANAEYIVDDTARIRDQLTGGRESLPITEGLDRLRTALRVPGSSVRLVGLSGTGKTRLAQALFDARVGHHALPSQEVVYCDVAHNPVPTPAGMIQGLKHTGDRAVVVVDNCPPDVHRLLTSQCKAAGGSVSLLTIEFDVADDVPEETAVFKLESASDEVIERLLIQRTPQVSSVDRHRIALFSGGNARIALALAAGVEQGESISRLSDRELRKRLFEQRQGSSENLLRAAEAVSLVYSFNADTSVESPPELSLLSQIAEMSLGSFLRSVKALQDRDLVQSRGVWRALLPQALADTLAGDALPTIPQYALDQILSQQGNRRLATSFTRRMSGLHDSETAQALVRKWLMPDGRLGTWNADAFTRPTQFANVAPVAPDAALAAIERWASGPDVDAFLAPRALYRSTYVEVLTAIAYDPALFPRAAWVLARMAAMEPAQQRHNGARGALAQLSQLALSGTHASLDQRLDLANRLLRDPTEALQDVAVDVFDSLMRDGTFTSFRSHGFGSRSRDFGWQPATRVETAQWFSAVLDAATAIAASDGARAPQLRNLIARHFKTFWHAGLPTELMRTCELIGATGTWADGWIAARKLLRRRGSALPPDDRERLERIVESLQPCGVGQVARAYIFSVPWSGLDVVEGERDDETSGQRLMDAHEAAERRTEELGYELSSSSDLDGLLPDLVAGQAHRAVSFGKGLALGAQDLSLLWRRLVARLEATADGSRDATVLVGYLQGASERDGNAIHELLDDAATHPVVRQWMPHLQLQTAIDDRGLKRCHEAIAQRTAPARSFQVLAYGRRSEGVSPDQLCRLLLAITGLPDGLPVAVEILHMRLFADNKSQRVHDTSLLACGRGLLKLCDFAAHDQSFDYHLAELARMCLAQPEADAEAQSICEAVFGSESVARLSWYAYDQLLLALFEVRPFECLDICFGSGVGNRLQLLCTLRKSVFDAIPLATILEWAQRDPAARFPIVGMGLRPLKSESGEDQPEWSEAALAVLSKAPDPLAVLQGFASQFIPTSWSGSRAAVIESRRALLAQFVASDHAAEASWAREEDQRLADAAARERAHESKESLTFE